MDSGNYFSSRYLTSHRDFVKVVGNKSHQGSPQKAPSCREGFAKASGKLRRKPRCLLGSSASGQEGQVITADHRQPLTVKREGDVLGQVGRGRRKP